MICLVFLRPQSARVRSCEMATSKMSANSSGQFSICPRTAEPSRPASSCYAATVCHEDCVHLCGLELAFSVIIGRLALPWHFGSMLRKSAVAVGASVRDRLRSEQLGDDGAADFRQRGLWRRSVGGHIFSPDPQPSGAGAADRQKRCRSSAHADADRSRTGPRSRQDRVPA